MPTFAVCSGLRTQMGPPNDNCPMLSVLPPLTNSWIIIIIGLYVALDMTPNIDCYWGGSTQPIL